MAVVALWLVGNYRAETHIRNIQCNAGIFIEDTTQSIILVPMKSVLTGSAFLNWWVLAASRFRENYGSRDSTS